MRNKLAWVGAVFTAIYLSGFTWFIFSRLSQLQKMELNNVGDFLAGAFGPIAFFWLILGFMQQGKELKLSSDALLLQAKELKASVRKQKELVAVSKSQQLAAENNVRMESARIASSIEPKFVLVGALSLQPSDGTTFIFDLYNGGFVVTNLEVFHQDISLLHKPILGAGDSARFNLRFKDCNAVSGCELRVNYLNGIESLREKSFRIGFVMYGGGTGFQVLINQRQGEFVSVH